MKINQGDILYLNFDPQAGHEQGGRRPALVVSNDIFNNNTNLLLVCPITSTKKPRPTNIALDDKTKTTGFILCEHIKALDIMAREPQYIEKAPNYILDAVLKAVEMFL